MKKKLSLLLLSVALLGRSLGQTDAVESVDPYIRNQAHSAETHDAKPAGHSSQVGVLVEYIQVDDRVANKLVRKHAASLSARLLREELEEMLDKETAELVETSYLKAKSGQRGKVESVNEMIYPTEYDPPEIPQEVTGDGDGDAPSAPANPTAFEMRPVGLTLEVDATISPDGKQVEMSIAPEVIKFLGRSYMLDEKNDLEPGTPEMLLATIWQPDFFAMKHSSAVEIADGDTMLLALHRPAEAPDKSILVLLRVDVLK